MRVPDGRLAPIRTAIGSAPANATMQLLHQTWRSRIDRLNVAAVIAASSGKYGDQQRFSASTRSETSSVRQKRYDDTIDRYYGSVLAIVSGRVGSSGFVRYAQRAHLVEVAAADSRDHLSPVLGVRNVLALGFRNFVLVREAVARRRHGGALGRGRDHLGHDLLPDLDALFDQRKIDRREGALPCNSLDPFLRLVAHEPGRDPEDPLRRFGGVVEGRDQRILLVVAGNELGLAAVGPGFCSVTGR